MIWKSKVNIWRVEPVRKISYAIFAKMGFGLPITIYITNIVNDFSNGLDNVFRNRYNNFGQNYNLSYIFVFKK